MRPTSLPANLNHNNNNINGGSGFCPETPALPEEEAALLAKLEEANRYLSPSVSFIMSAPADHDAAGEQKKK